MTFTWDEANEANYFHKHHIHFAEAVSVFDDPYAIESVDKRHGEVRFTIIGVSCEHRLLRVTYCIETVDEIRIISARRASPANRKAYLSGII